MIVARVRFDSAILAKPLHQFDKLVRRYGIQASVVSMGGISPIGVLDLDALASGGLQNIRH